MRSPETAPTVGLCLLIAAPALALVAAPAEADSREIFGFLPQPLVGGFAFSSGGSLYHLGGSATSGPVADVVRFDATGARTTLPSLPYGVAYGASGFDGRYAYIVGGNPTGPEDGDVRVVRFDPSTGASTVLAAQLAVPTLAASGVVVDGGFYVFGGFTAQGCTTTIQRLDLATGGRVTMSSRFPVPICWSTAAWTGEKAYVIGGFRYGGALSPSTIYEYDPRTDALTDLGPILPQDVYYASSVWTGDVVLLLGPETTEGPKGNVLKFDPATRETTEMREKLPSRRSLGAAAWDGERAFFFGGYGPTGAPERTFFEHVIAFDFLPAAPTLVTAAPGPEPGSVALSWTLPDPATYTKLQRLVVQRSTIEDAAPAQSVTFAIPLGESLVDQDLVPGIRYFYRVAAETREGRGAWSEEFSSRASVLPAGPTVLGARPLADADGDGITDSTEATACSGVVVPALLNGMSPAYAGTCTGANYWAGAWWDKEDDDGIPDRVEPALCTVLVAEDLRRGVCTGQDFGVTPIAWSELVALPELPLA